MKILFLTIDIQCIEKLSSSFPGIKFPENCQKCQKVGKLRILELRLKELSCCCIWSDGYPSSGDLCICNLTFAIFEDHLIKNMDFYFFVVFQPSAGDLCIAIFTSIFSTWGLVKCHPKNLSSGNICKIVFPSPLQFSLWRLALNIMMIIRHLLAFDSPLANSFRLIRKLRGLH